MALQNSNDDKSLRVIADRPQIIQGTPGEFDDPRNIPPGYRLSADGVNLERIPVEPEGTSPDIVFGDPKGVSTVTEQVDSDPQDVVGVTLEDPPDASVTTEPATSTSSLFPSAQAAEAEPVVEEPVVEKARPPLPPSYEAVQPDITVQKFNNFLKTKGLDNFVNILNRNMIILAEGRDKIFGETIQYDPPQKDIRRYYDGKIGPDEKWHWGIPLQDYIAAIVRPDPRTRGFPSIDVQRRRKLELLKNRVMELGIGETEYGRNIFADPTPGIFDTESIGFNGNQFYVPASIGERLEFSAHDMATATARAIIYGVPDAIIAINELGGMGLAAITEGVDIPFAHVRDAIENLLNMNEEDAITHAQIETEEFFKRLDLNAQQNQNLRDWVTKIAYDLDLPDLIGERFGGTTMASRIVEETIPYIITLAMPMAQASKLAKLGKSMKLTQRVHMQNSGLLTGQYKRIVDNRVEEILSKSGEFGRGISAREKAELLYLRKQQEVFADIKPKELAYIREWPYEYKGGKFRLSESAQASIRNIEVAMEAGAGTAAAYAASAFGEDHWAYMVAPIVGSVAASNLTGNIVQSARDKSLYSLSGLEFAGFRILDLLDVPNADKNMARTAIKMFGLQSQAKEKMSEVNFQRARDHYKALTGENLSNKAIRQLIHSNTEEYNRLSALSSRSVTQERRFKELSGQYFPLDGSNWQGDLTGLNLEQLQSIVSERPAKLKKLQASAQTLIASMDKDEQKQFVNKIRNARKTAEVLEAEMKSRGITGPDGGAQIAMFLDNFVESAVLGAVAKDLLDRNSLGMTLRPDKTLKLWTTYFKMQKQREQSVDNLKRLVDDVLDPLTSKDAGVVNTEIADFKDSIEKSITAITEEINENATRVQKHIAELAPRMRDALEDEAARKQADKMLSVREALNMNFMDDVGYRQHTLERINILNAQLVERWAEKHTALYEELKNNPEWTVALPMDELGPELLEVASEFPPLTSWEKTAKVVPGSVKIAELVSDARKQSLYKLANASEERSANGRPMGYGNLNELDALVEDLIERGWDDTLIPIIRAGGKGQKYVLSKQNWNNHLKQRQVIQDRKAVDEFGEPLEGRDLQRFEAAKKQAEANLVSNFIEDLVYVPDSAIPMDVSLDILNAVRSRVSIEAHRYAHDAKGIRLQKIKQKIDGISEIESDELDAAILSDTQLDLFDRTQLSPAQIAMIDKWKDAHVAYREFMDKVKGTAFGKEITKEGDQGAVYLPGIIDGDYDLRDIPVLNAWSKLFVLNTDVDTSAREFVKAFGDSEGKVPDEILHLLLNTVGMNLNRNRRLPPEWWSAYEKIFTGSGLPVEKLGQKIKDWEDFSDVIRGAEQPQIMSVKAINDIDTEGVIKNWKIDKTAVEQAASKELKDLGRTLDTAHSRTILDGLSNLLDPKNSQDGQLPLEVIKTIFSRNPSYYSSKKIWGSVDFPDRNTTNLEEIGTEWTQRLGEDQQDFVKMYLGRFANSEQTGRTYVRPIDDVFKLLDNAVEQKKITPEQLDQVHKTLQHLFARFLAETTFEKTQYKSLIKHGEPAEIVDIAEMHDLLIHHQDTIQRLYNKDDADLVNRSFSMIHDLRAQFENEQVPRGMARGMTVESALARGFALTRGVVSWRWVLGEQAIKNYRMQSMRQLTDFLANPTSLRHVEAVLTKEASQLTDLDLRNWKAAFVHTLPTTMARFFTLEALKEEVEQYQEEVERFKQAYPGTPIGKSIAITSGLYGERGLPSQVPNILFLRRQMERMQSERKESERRGAAPIDQDAASRRRDERASEVLERKHGGLIHSQMQRLLN